MIALLGNIALVVGPCFSLPGIFHAENQDGVGRHTVPPRTTRTDRKLNSKEVRHQVDKKEHTSRLVGGAETGTRAERTRVGHGGTDTGGVWDQRGRQSDH